ncbi:MAG: AbrB/MazE/SpoVT family DNA-binding domain-containing protein [Bryobacteraceae bacterium]
MKVKIAQTSRISSKGQITVPVAVRRRLGLREGDQVEFVTEGTVTILRPARSVANPFEEYTGALHTFPGGREEINAWIGDLRDEKADE